VLPTQPAGDQPGQLLPAQVPVGGIEVPGEIQALLAEREVATWVGRPVGEATRGYSGETVDRWGHGLFWSLVAAMLQLPFAYGVLEPLLPFLGGGLFTVSGLMLVGVPLRRAARRRSTWCVLTTERVGLVRIETPPHAEWVAATDMKGVEVTGLKKDGSGTIVVRHRPDRYGMAPDPLVIGRIPDVRNAADLIDLLGRDQR
jgi:hypothetical protein